MVVGDESLWETKNSSSRVVSSGIVSVFTLMSKRVEVVERIRGGVTRELDGVDYVGLNFSFIEIRKD